MNSRRTLLKGGLAGGIAASAGLLTPQALFAAWPKAAFEAKDMDSALSAAVGAGNASQSDAIKIKAPDIAENGAVVPVTIDASISGAESITMFALANNSPMVANFILHGSAAYAATRIKMGKTGDVVAVVKADGKLMMNKKEVKVTIGGCGG